MPSPTDCIVGPQILAIFVGDVKLVLLHIWWNCPLIASYWGKICIHFYKRSFIKRWLTAANILIPRSRKTTHTSTVKEWLSEVNTPNSLEEILAMANDRKANIIKLGEPGLSLFILMNIPHNGHMRSMLYSFLLFFLVLLVVLCYNLAPFSFKSIKNVSHTLKRNSSFCVINYQKKTAYIGVITWNQPSFHHCWRAHKDRGRDIF